MSSIPWVLDSLHWQHLLVKLSDTATLNSHYSTCLGHLGEYHGQGKYIQDNIAGGVPFLVSARMVLHN
jgi:hypothetical protein